MFTVTVSGSSITNSSMSAQFSGADNSMQFGHMIYDNTNNTGYIVYRNEAGSDYPTIQTYTVSGDTFTFGTETVIESTAALGYVGIAEGSADSKGVVVAWKNGTTTIRYATPTFSGLTPTIGTVSTVSSVPSAIYYEGAQVVSYNSTSQTFQLAYQDTSGSNYDIVTNTGTVSSGTLTWSNYILVSDTTNQAYYAISHPTGQGANNVFVTQYRQGVSPYQSVGVLYAEAYSTSTSNLTAENFIGIANTTVSTNEALKVRIGGVDDNQESLTAGQLYYIQANGTLDTTAATPSVEAGKALSSTKLLVNTS